MVYVTVALDPEETPTGPLRVVWSALGLTACTPKSSGLTVVCCIPRGVFEHSARVKLEILPTYRADEVVLDWTHIPSLGEVSFQAGMVGGQPVLAPIRESSVSSSSLVLM